MNTSENIDNTVLRDVYADRLRHRHEIEPERPLTNDEQRAIELALSWAGVARDHGVTVEDLDLVASLPATALDAIRAADRRQAEQ